MVTAAMKLKDACSLEEKLWRTWTAYLKAETSLCWQALYSQSYGFLRSHVWMWELDHKKDQGLKNWCSQAVVLEWTLECPLDSEKIKPVNPKGNQSWIQIGRTNDKPVHSEGDQPWDFFGGNDAEAETPVLWPPHAHAKSWLIGKDSDGGRDCGQEEKGMTEDEMAGWHHWLNGHESEWTLGVGDGQGGLACCNSWGHKESDTTEQLNWTEQN